MSMELLSMTEESPMSWTIIRSEEHTSELQSRLHLVCRLLLEKKKNKSDQNSTRLNCSHCHTSHAVLCYNTHTRAPRRQLEDALLVARELVIAVRYQLPSRRQD